MANEVTEVTEEKVTEEVVENNHLFPMTRGALNTLSDLFIDLDEDKYNNELTGLEKEIVDRPMLYLAQKICNEFDIWTIDLIKYIAILNGMDVKIDKGGWFIKIKGENE